MATKAHKNLTGVDLHEPKGITTATSGQVYEADGIGSGVWTSLVIPTGTFYISYSTFTATGTWSKPLGIFLAKVTVIGTGGGGDCNSATQAGTTSFGSYVSATGGICGAGSPGGGGTSSTGDLNFGGNNGGSAGTAGAGQAGLDFRSLAGILYGQGNYGNAGTNQGGGGGAAIKWLTASALLNATETVTIGATSSNGVNGQPGVAGIVIVEQYISV